MSFSVLMSVYINDKPEYVDRAVQSVTKLQTLKPDEIVLVVDGPVSHKVSELIDSFEKSEEYNFNVLRLAENKGLGNALRIGLEASTHEIVARMDSDDVSLPDRFEKQISYLENHPGCDIVGGQISEFVDEESNIIGERNVPCKNDDILTCLKWRNPFNHMSVMMLRSRVMAVGNYIDLYLNEDYFLWIRMAEAGYHFANLPDISVNVRVGKEMYARRGGWKYLKSQERLQRYMLQHKLIGLPRYLLNVAGRFTIQVAMPDSLRGWIYQKFFRKQQKPRS